MDHPKLRPIEAFPVDLGGRQVICLGDPTQLTDAAVFVPREALFLLAYFDGKHSILDIQEAYTRQSGHIFLSDAIKGLIAKLDESLLLDNERFETLILSTMPATAGTVLTYDQAVEPATQSMVSYASVVFH